MSTGHIFLWGALAATALVGGRARARARCKPGLLQCSVAFTALMGAGTGPEGLGLHFWLGSLFPWCVCLVSMLRQGQRGWRHTMSWFCIRRDAHTGNGSLCFSGKQRKSTRNCRGSPVCAVGHTWVVLASQSEHPAGFNLLLLRCDWESASLCTHSSRAESWFPMALWLGPLVFKPALAPLGAVFPVSDPRTGEPNSGLNLLFWVPC